MTFNPFKSYLEAKLNSVRNMPPEKQELFVTVLKKFFGSYPDDIPAKRFMVKALEKGTPESICEFFVTAHAHQKFGKPIELRELRIIKEADGAPSLPDIIRELRAEQ